MQVYLGLPTRKAQNAVCGVHGRNRHGWYSELPKRKFCAVFAVLLCVSHGHPAPTTTPLDHPLDRTALD